MEIHKRKGHNSAFPEKILTWKKGQKVPEWLSDKAKIVAINGIDGSVMLGTRNTSSGGIEILDSSGTRVLVRTSGVDDFVCINADNLISTPFVLTPIQLSLLYGRN